MAVRRCAVGATVGVPVGATPTSRLTIVLTNMALPVASRDVGVAPTELTLITSKQHNHTATHHEHHHPPDPGIRPADTQPHAHPRRHPTPQKSRHAGQSRYAGTQQSPGKHLQTARH